MSQENTPQENMSRGNSQDMTFEQALAQLEKLVNEIESGRVPLEESIAKYAQGTGLIDKCRSILDQAERKIQLLARGQGDELKPAGDLPEQPGE